MSDAPIADERVSGSAPLTSPAGAGRRLVVGVCAAVLLLGIAAIPPVLLLSDGGKERALPAATGYHALVVAPDDREGLLLGTPEGLFRSRDAGRTWVYLGPFRQDAFGIAWLGSDTIWTGGPESPARSGNGGDRWTLVYSSGLPRGEVRALAVDPHGRDRFYAAVGGHGLYRTNDGGDSFERVSDEVGRRVTSLAVGTDGRILATEVGRGLLESRDAGRTWKRLLGGPFVAVAAHPRRPGRILAAGPGIMLSENGGKDWRRVMESDRGAFAVAWSPSDPRVVYAVGIDGKLYRSTDRGFSWRAD